MDAWAAFCAVIRRERLFVKGLPLVSLKVATETFAPKLP